MKKILFIASVFIISISTKAQLTKGNWMLGGNGRFAFIKQTLNSSDANGINFQLTPSIGYFLSDKLVGGLKAKLAYDKIVYNGGITSITTFTGFGPFLRYYFLDSESRLNIFAESVYQYLHYSGNGTVSTNANAFIISSGSVYYLNTSIGIEFALNYEFYNNKVALSSSKTLFMSLGFQIHLEKEHN